MEHKCELVYPQKEPTKHILNKKPTGVLYKIKTMGNQRLDQWENMLIFGENFTALKLLLNNPAINRKVRIIYIDPPFSTNQVFLLGEKRTATVSKSFSDKNAYEDRLIGAEYLEFIRKRLILLREILADNGSIYVHLDCKMGHYVKILMDEIFGPDRFVNDISRIKCNPKNFSRKGYGNIKDMILFYTKTENYIWNEPRQKMTEEDIKRLFPKTDKEGRRYTTTPLHAPGETLNGVTGKPWKGIKPPVGRHWRYKPEELDRLEREGLIEWSSSGNPRKIIYADEVRKKGKKVQDIWEFKDPQYPTYPTEKNLEMLKMIIKASSNPNDIVLDCFSGSGTTLVAAEQTGRRWIGIDQSEAAVNITIKRLSSIKKVSAYSLFKIKLR